MKWRRAIAAVCALDLLATAVRFLWELSDGLIAAVVLATPPGVVGAIAAWWAWRGWERRVAPPTVVSALWAMGGLAVAVGLVYLLTQLLGDGYEARVGLPAAIAAPAAALLAARMGYRRQRARVERAALVEAGASQEASSR